MSPRPALHAAAFVLAAFFLSPANAGDVPLDRTPSLAAVSADGQWVLQTDPASAWLQMVDACGRIHPVAAGPSVPARLQVRQVFSVPTRRSFVAVLDLPAEVWEISHDPEAEPVYDGWVHDHRMREGLARPGFLGARRMLLERPLRGELFLSTHPAVLVSIEGSAADPTRLARWVQLDVRREILQVPVPASLARGDHFSLDAQGLHLALVRVPDAATGSALSQRQRPPRSAHCTP